MSLTETKIKSEESKKSQKSVVQKYTRYKDSGIPWLGEIPEHWEALSNKFVFEMKKKLVGKKSEDYDLLSLTLRGIVIRNIEDGGKFPADYNTYQEVKVGDFVFCLFDVEETPRCIGLSEFAGMITGAYTVMAPKKSFNRKFLYYFYLNLDSDKRLRPLYTGLRNTISKESFFSFKTFIPPLPEQTAITNFLDDKTAKIDQAIAIKEKQIALLKERKQILIHQLVTGQLTIDNGKWIMTPREKMKDSGVECLPAGKAGIGEIPAHWEVKRLKYIGNSIIGLTYSPSDLCGQEGTLVFRSSNLFEGKIVYGEKENVYVKTRIPEKLMVARNDILICSRNGSRELIGKCALIKENDLGASFGAFTTVFRSKYNTYIFCVLNSSIFKSLAGSFLTSTINQLTIGNLNSIYVPFPPLSEQQQIASHIDTTSQKIDTAISLKEQEIEKLKEYKSSLINSVVTGKVRVG